MKVKLSKDVEKERLQSPRAEKTWEYLKTRSQVEALHFARDNGWKDNKVQVRVAQTSEGYDFYVEPYEGECGCKNILKYRDFFD